MQFKKSFIRSAILENARKEFLEVGFMDATIRSIAKRANTAPSNIYNYYSNKDELFRGVLDDFLKQFSMAKAAFMEHVQNDPEHDPDDDEHNEMIEQILDAVSRYREELTLLIHLSKGSSLEHFLDDLIDWYSGVYTISLYKMLEEMELEEVEIMPETTHMIAGMIISMVVTTLDKHYNRAQIKSIALELSQFFSAGWKGLVSWKIEQVN
ncbi:MAG: TetR/AcrR family transcriptional regulator [Candidatus Cloacimonetes bacterium]|nr:TetR/AcrR family transcriptional regulator [Candidatus Cloacimonadota bacterium]